ncbi:hypothetical protein QOT17_010381 [Balamuthia mandrillaris]
MSTNGKACVPCRAAHQACDRGRPCGRCRHLKRVHLCKDPPPPFCKRVPPAFLQQQQQQARCESKKEEEAACPATLSHDSSPSSAPSLPFIVPCALALYPADGSPPKKRKNYGEPNHHHSYNDNTRESADSPPSQSPNRSFSSSSLSSSASGRSTSLLDTACLDFDLLALPLNSFSSSSTASSSSSSALSSLCSSPIAPSFSSASSACPSPAPPALSTNDHNNHNHNNDHNNNSSTKILKLWLPPINIGNSLLSKAHRLECVVDNQLREPWVLIRPTALESCRGSIVAVNSTFLKLSGYSQSEILGQSLGLIVPEELLQIMDLTFSMALAQWGDISDGRVMSRNISGMTTKGGTWLMTQSQSTFHFDSAGELLCVAVQLVSAIPVQRDAIDWSKQAGMESWQKSPDSPVTLPKDARFHDGSFFASAPLTSVSVLEEFSSTFSPPSSIKPSPPSSSSSFSSSSAHPASSPATVPTPDALSRDSSATSLDLLLPSAYPPAGADRFSQRLELATTWVCGRPPATPPNRHPKM